MPFEIVLLWYVQNSVKKKRDVLVHQVTQSLSRLKKTKISNVQRQFKVLYSFVLLIALKNGFFLFNNRGGPRSLSCLRVKMPLCDSNFSVVSPHSFLLLDNRFVMWNSCLYLKLRISSAFEAISKRHPDSAHSTNHCQTLDNDSHCRRLGRFQQCFFLQFFSFLTNKFSIVFLCKWYSSKQCFLFNFRFKFSPNL